MAASTGLVGGALGAVYGAGTAPIYGMYLKSLNLEKAVFRVTASTVLLVPLTGRLIGYSGMGYFSSEVLVALAVAVPFMMVGTWLGDALLRDLDERKFGQLVSGVLIISGMGLVVM